MRTRRQQSSSDPMPLSERHRPVLLHEVSELLAIQPDDTVVDATLGGAGHAEHMVEKLGEKGIFLGIDADSAAIERAREKLAASKARVILEQGNFRNVGSYLGKHMIQSVDKALFDLGWSSYQLKSGRGFSFLADEPLVMTYADTGATLTAETIVNTWGEESIADILYGWGDERYSRRIARAIVDVRANHAIRTSKELASIVAQAVPPVYRRGKTHPATKTFQALRIAVNDEFGALKESVDSLWQHIAPHGRIAIITFHSTEDREVKQMFRELAATGGTLVTRKPLVPTREEVLQNPRARSSKLRCIEKN